MSIPLAHRQSRSYNCNPSAGSIGACLAEEFSADDHEIDRTLEWTAHSGGKAGLADPRAEWAVCAEIEGLREIKENQ